MIKKTFTAITIIVCSLILFVGISFYHAGSFLKHRDRDLDKDGIVNSEDPDVDGDGIPNLADPDADNDGIPNTKDMLMNAQKLIGRPYDQLNGDFKNISWHFGGIVCIDVVNLALEKSGIYFEKELRDLYWKNKRAFVHRSWNNPYDRNFGRRVRNFRVFCREYNLFVTEKEGLLPGDMVMFGDGHIAIIDKVKGYDYTVIEASGKKIFAMRASKEDIFRRSYERYGKDIAYARLSKLWEKK